MSVEFRCDQCQNLLRTGDDAIGRKARCPQCGNIQTVPAATSDLAPEPSAPARASESYAPTTPSGPSNPFAVDPSPNPFGASTGSRAYPTSQANIRSKLMGPAIAMLITSFLGCALTGLVLIAGVTSVATKGMADDDAVMLTVFSVSFVLSLVATAGSIQMLRQRTYGLAMTAVVLSLLPTSCVWCLSLPFGIWALVVLLDRDVRASFR